MVAKILNDEKEASCIKDNHPQKLIGSHGTPSKRFGPARAETL